MSDHPADSSDPEVRRAYWKDKVQRSRVEQGLPPKLPREVLEEMGRRLAPLFT